MIDLATMRPTDDGKPAIAAALLRAKQAAIVVGAAVDQLRQERDTMLLVGTPEGLAAAESKLAEAGRDGERVLTVHRLLEEALAAAVVARPTLHQARTEAMQANLAFAAWWQQDGQALTTGLMRGLQLLGTAATSAAALAQVEGEVGGSPGSNVVSLLPPASA